VGLEFSKGKLNDVLGEAKDKDDQQGPQPTSKKAKFWKLIKRLFSFNNEGGDTD
jgi:hypothetical protein